MWAKWLHNPYRIEGPQRGEEIKSGYITLAKLGGGGANSGKPCSIKGPQCTEDIRSGYVTLAILGAHVWAKWLHIPSRAGGTQSGDKSQVASQPSSRPTCGQSENVTPVVSGVPT